MDPSIQQLTAQLASEQKANGVLALRLQTLKASQLPASRLSELCAHETENAAWRRLFQSMALRGRSPLEAVKDEAFIQEHSGVPPAESFWSFLQTLGLGIAPPLPAPLAPLAPRLPAPLLDCFLVCGPAFDALLGLWRTPAFGRALGEEAPPLAVSLASFISGASHPQAVLQPEVLYTYPPDAPLPAEPSALSAFCFPEGAAVSAVPLPSLVAQLRAQGSSFALDRGGSLDCLFERAPGQGKGPRTHTFLLTGSQSDAPFSSSQLAQASFGSSAATEARTRYCMCLAVTATVTLNMLHGLATGHPPKGDSSPHFALSVPTVFCAVSRYPFFPAHAYLLRAVSAQWRRVQEARMRQFGLGRVASADPASSAAATGSPAAAPASAEAEGEEGASAAEAVEVAAAEEEAPLPPPSAASWRSMFSKAESPPPKQPASFWGHFHLGSPSAAASRRSSTAAPLPAAAAAALQRQSLADTALAPSPAQPPTAAPAFLSEDEQALLAARLAVHCFPEPLVATVAAYASLPVPQHGGTLQWRQGLAPLNFCRPPRSSSSSSSSSGGALEESGGSAPQPAYDTAVGLRDPETRAALLAHALPVLASLLPPDSLLLLLGAALTEKRLVFVGGALSLEALTAAVAAFPLLLSPLAWEGLHLPVLPQALLEVLQAPLPYIVGLRSLPPRFEQDEETIVVLLDRETLRIPASHIPSGLFGGGSGDRTAGGGGAAAAAAPEAQLPSPLSASPLPPPPDFLSILIPETSTLFHRLEPLAALLRQGAGEAAPGPAPAAARRPCYSPTPQQAAAVQQMADAVQAHVAGILARAEACHGQLEGFPEAERPFWARFLGSQMFCCLQDEKAGKAAAADAREAAMRAGRTMELYGGGGLAGAAHKAGPKRAAVLPPSVEDAGGGSPRRRVVGAAWRTQGAAAVHKVVAVRSASSLQ